MSIERKTDGKLGHIGAALDAILASRPATAAIFRKKQITRHWELIVGAKLAAHSWPDSVKGDKLIIGTTGSSWCETLESMEAKIVGRLNRICPGLGVKRMWVTIGVDVRPPKPDTLPVEPRTGPTLADLDAVSLNSVTARRVAELAAQIEDPALRASFARCYRRSLQLRCWRLSHGYTISDSHEFKPPQS